MLLCLGCFQDFVLSYCSYTCDSYAGTYCAQLLLRKIAWLADVPAKSAVVLPSVFAKEPPASSAPRDEAPQQAESKPLPEEALGSAQGQASRMLNETQVRFEAPNVPHLKSSVCWHAVQVAAQIVTRRTTFTCTRCHDTCICTRCTLLTWSVCAPHSQCGHIYR